MRMSGNLINRIMESSTSPTPEIGMGVTECCHSDRHAYTILEIFSPCKITVQRDTAIRTDKHGMSDAQSYRYERNAAGETKVLTKRRDGSWREAGVSKGDSNGFLLGHRDEHYDYSF